MAGGQQNVLRSGNVVFSRWDPFRDLLTLQERIDRLTGEYATGWAPPVDLYETSERYEVIVEVPGLARDEIHIRIEAGTLTIEGERRSPDVPCEQYHRIERGHGRFVRSFQLPDAVDSTATTADPVTAYDHQRAEGVAPRAPPRSGSLVRGTADHAQTDWDRPAAHRERPRGRACADGPDATGR